MTLQPLAPALPDDDAGPRWSFAASAVLHGLILLAVLGLAVRPSLPEGGTPPSYEFVFDGPPGGAPPTDPAKTQQLPPPQPADITPPPDAVLGTPAPDPLSAPDPTATGSPPPAAENAPPAPTPVPASPPDVPVPVAPPDVPAPQEVPVEPDAPAVRLQTPPVETAPAGAEAIMPEAPPPLPPMPQPPPRPASRPAPRPAPRSAFGTLSNPMNLSLAPSAPRPAARGSVASRSIDLSPPPERNGPLQADPYADIRAANASADWNRGLRSYWERHRYYPNQALANGEDGDVTIQLTVNRSGKVENVEIVSRSGSQWIDMAAVGTWRNAQLPPFTNEMREERITFPIPLHYILIR